MDAPYYTIVNPLTLVRLPRRLPHTGELLVNIGDTVEATQAVAQCVEPPAFCIINVSQELGVPPKKAAEHLKVKIGSEVKEGQILAARGLLGGRTCYAPMHGTITGFGRGRLLLEAPPHTTTIHALVPGTVVELFPDSGVLIEAVGAFIQGIWGNEQESYGVLHVMVKNPRQPLRAKNLDPAVQGTIIVGGIQLDEETLNQAKAMQVRGILVGSIPPALLSTVRALEFPVVATEGIGETPMCEAIFQLLRSLDGREIAVNGHMRSRWGPERPYALVPMPAANASPVAPEQPLKPGSRVRALRAPYRGLSGKVVAIQPGLTTLETGARLPGVQVAFNDETAFIPYANLERLL